MKRNQNKSFLPVVAASLMVTNAMAQTDKRPNILYIMSDDHAYQEISAYGSVVLDSLQRPISTESLVKACGSTVRL